MGSKPTDAGTMKSASSGAQAADQQLASNAKQNQDFMNAARAKLFGSANGSGDFSGGTLSKFLDPNSLNVDQPSGVYGLQYKQAVGNIAKQSQDVRGSISRYNASRGFGNAPAGFAQDQERRAAEDQVGQQGAAFSDYAGKSYQDALQNFWRASGSLSGEGDSALSASIAADSAAANNYANLYGTASTPKPSPWGSIIGGGLSAGGQVGAASMSKKNRPGGSILMGGSDPSICWIAEALYGENDQRTHLVRAWLRDVYSKTPSGGVIVGLYKRHGQRVAAWVRRWRPLRAFFRPLFDRALSNALAQRQGQVQAQRPAKELDFESVEFQR